MRSNSVMVAVISSSCISSSMGSNSVVVAMIGSSSCISNRGGISVSSGSVTWSG
jgi:hypothetical protein